MSLRKHNDSFFDSDFVLSEASDVPENKTKEIAELYLPSEILKSPGEKIVEQVKLIKKRDSSGR